MIAVISPLAVALTSSNPADGRQTPPPTTDEPAMPHRQITSLRFGVGCRSPTRLGGMGKKV
jgi:hypothetical protein